jgi:uncharacterized protein
MRCSYCYAPPHGGPAMSEATARQAMELGSRLGSGSCGVIFFGGEPLLQRERIEALVGAGREMERRQAGRFHFKMTTNGLLLDESFLEFSIRNDVLIAMSFDGVAEAHDRHRRTPEGGGTFEQLLPKLRMLLDVRPYSSVLMVVNPDTAKYLCDSVSFLLDLGCRYLIVSLNYAADWNESSFSVLQQQLKRLGKLYIQWTQQGRKFYLSPFEVKLSSHINRDCYRKERCELAARQISVDPDGYLYPCVQFPKAGSASQFCIGHVETGIDEEAREQLRRESEQEKAFCRGCAISQRCNNTCGCLNWQTTGTINGISPVLCRYEQMLIPIVDAVGEKLYRRRDPLFIQKHYNSAYPVLSLLDDVLPKPGRSQERAS